MRPSGISFEYLDGDLLVWAALSVVSVVIGLLAAILLYDVFSTAIGNIVSPTFSEAQGLTVFLSVAIAVAMGIVVTVGSYRGLLRQWFR